MAETVKVKVAVRVRPFNMRGMPSRFIDFYLMLAYLIKGITHF